MDKSPLSWTAFDAAARKPPRVGLRAVLAILLELMLLLALLFGTAGAVRAEPVRGDIRASLSEGYARIVVRFSEPVDADVKLANGILVVGFAQPVQVAVDRLYSSAAGYVTAARRDPDGKAIRLALSQRVRLNAMTAGEQLFIDLLPDSWTAAPPSLPQDVVEELAKRVREAERKEREQRALTRREVPVSIVRALHLPTFSRYVFEMPEPVAVGAERSKDGLKLTFDTAVKFDLADVKATMPPTIEAVDTRNDDQRATVQFAFAGKVDTRNFREDDNYIVDVAPAGGKPEQAEVPSVRPAAARNRPPPTGAPTGIEPPQPMSSLVPPALVPPALTPADEVPSRAPSAPAQAPAVQASAAPGLQLSPPAVQAAQPGPPPAPPSGAAPAEAAPATPAPPAPAVAPPAPTAEGEQPPRLRNPDAPVQVELRRQSDNLKLTFPFAAPTPAAVFRRADTLWLVFDSAAPVDVATLTNDNRTIRSATVTRSQGGQVVRIKLMRPRLASMVEEGSAWSVTIGDVVMEPTRPLAVARNVVGVPHATASIPFADPSMLHRLADPEVGDTLLVVTGLGPARGLVKTQNFVEFRALASAHGVVIQPIADDVSAELALDKVVIVRPPGLSLSSGGPSARRSGIYRPQMFDPQAWGADREARFLDQQDKLVADAAAAPETKRSQPRYDLARFYLAREMYPEAKGVLDLALSDERPTAEDATGLVMRAIANIMLGRADEARKDLANPIVGNQYDSRLWLAFAQARDGRWAEAHEGFRGVAGSVGSLPLELQRLMLREAVHAAVELRDYAAAASVLNEFETLGIPPEIEPSIAVLAGRVAEGLGRNEDALMSYRLAAGSGDRAAAAQGQLRDAVLRYHVGDLKRPDVISSLETLTTVWRGDETEIEALQLLARLYSEDGRYRDAFYVMRTALKSHPRSETTRRIQDDAATVFNSLFLAGKGDAMPAIDALGLFYDFRELTPIGRRGDEMIRRLSDRLVSVDLLDQASELLQHQVDHRLQGAARAQVATRLAVIYLMSRKPDRALATLRATRSAELSGELRNQRLLLEGRALSDIGRRDLALEVIANIAGKEAVRLRADILWAAKRWGEAAEQIELLYGDRWSDWQPLADAERADILRAGMGYALAEDRIGRDRFRGKYAVKMAESPDRRAFDIVTTASNGSVAEFRDISRTIATVDTLDTFLRDMNARYPETGAFGASSRSPVAGSPASPTARADPTTTGSIPRRTAAKPRIAKDTALPAARAVTLR